MFWLLNFIAKIMKFYGKLKHIARIENNKLVISIL